MRSTAAGGADAPVLRRSLGAPDAAARGGRSVVGFEVLRASRVVEDAEQVWFATTGWRRRGHHSDLRGSATLGGGDQ